MGELLTAFGSAFAGASALALPAAFVWGVLSVALSPCHLSSVPLVVAYMNGGGDELPTGRRALWLASVFALGILASIAAIGAATAATGRMLGDVGRTGNWILAAVFFAVGLNLLGVLRLPSFGAPAVVRRRGAPGALFLGLVFGVALGPCTFAFMAPLLGLALRSSGAGDTAHGVLLVILYGLGHAAAIALAGTSLQSVQHWLGWRAGDRAIAGVRGVAGIAVLLGGTYFIWTAL